MRKPMRAASAAALLLVSLCAVPGAAAAGEPGPGASPAPLHRSADAVPGRYIITLKAGLSGTATAQKVAGVKPLFTYSSVFPGFAAQLDAVQLDAVRKLPGVEAVEEDAMASATPVGDAKQPFRATSSSWGLDRMDQPYLPLNNEIHVNGTGKGVTAYILDTGIEYGHSEFGGRAVFGFDAMGDGLKGADCNGHGTHVAGTVGGATYGVARDVSLVSVRVLNCESKGTYSGIIAGMEWVAANAKKPAVLNGSLGGPRSVALNTAATALATAGVLPVVAAGNSAVDACGISPAGADRVVTVGATDHADKETDFSNFGPCLWMYAPGVAITSAKLGGGSIAFNGTSMAAPHVAGVAALYQAENPKATPEAVAAWLAEQSTKGALTVSKGSPNRLLYTGGL
ncbi:S8 family peptidase [Streptomyces sp. NPDC002773]|uniref:S8 family peptidase n=1 Tax=Streptomyces sp. NPDC002773 TaxID=3154430 RepID=UPI0033218641